MCVPVHVILYYITLYYIILYYIILHCIILYHITLYYTILYYIVLYYILSIEISDALSEDQLYVLAQLCVDFMYELHEFYAEVMDTSITQSIHNPILYSLSFSPQDFTLYPLALSAHIDAFWSFFVVDLQECLRTCDACIVSLLKMFYSLNEYFCSQRESEPNE